MITTKVRFSFVRVFEAKESPDGVLKFSVSILLPKDDTKGVEEVKSAIHAAIEKGLTTNKFAKAHVSSLKLPLRDGDEAFDNSERGKEYQGHYFFNASSEKRPGIIDEHGKPIFDPDDFYSGCYGHADVNFYPFNKAGNKGVGVGLNNIMKVGKDAERLDGRMKAEDAFAEFISESETEDDAPFETELL